MQTIEDIFDYVKFSKLLEGFTDIKPGSGIRHRMAGKGTNKNDKVQGLTEKDKEGIKAGLKQFFAEANAILDKE